MDNEATLLRHIQYRKRFLVIVVGVGILLIATILTGVAFAISINQWLLGAAFLLSLAFPAMLIFGAKVSRSMIRTEEKILAEEGAEAVHAFRRAHPFFDYKVLRRFSKEGAQPDGASNAS